MKEFLVNKDTAVMLNIAGSEINSVRKTVDVYNTVRVYEGGNIGVAGSVGQADWAQLEKEAKEKLADGLQYPCDLPQHGKRTLNNAKTIPHAELMTMGKQLLEKFNAIASDKFIMSGGIYYEESESSYTNSNGVDYKYIGAAFRVEIIMKDKRKANMFDTYYAYSGDQWDAEAMLNDFAMVVNSYDIPVDITNGKYTVIMEPSFLASMAQHFIAEMYAVGASIFSGKLGQKVFSDKFSMYSDYTATRPNSAFFDCEGETGEDGKGYYIREGVLDGLITTKKVSAKYGLPKRVGAAAPYDGLPNYGFARVHIGPTCERIEDVIGDKAIWVVIASGGDMTTSGDYATPVQDAYLVENGKIVGRLPDISIHANIFDMLGADYCGASDYGMYVNGYTNWVAMKMNVEK